MAISSDVLIFVVLIIIIQASHLSPLQLAVAQNVESDKNCIHVMGAKRAVTEELLGCRYQLPSFVDFLAYYMHSFKTLSHKSVQTRDVLCILCSIDA